MREVENKLTQKEHLYFHILEAWGKSQWNSTDLAGRVKHMSIQSWLKPSQICVCVQGALVIHEDLFHDPHGPKKTWIISPWGAGAKHCRYSPGDHTGLSTVH